MGALRCCCCILHKYPEKKGLLRIDEVSPVCHMFGRPIYRRSPNRVICGIALGIICVAVAADLTLGVNIVTDSTFSEGRTILLALITVKFIALLSFSTWLAVRENFAMGRKNWVKV